MCDRDVSKDTTCAPDDYTAKLMLRIKQLQNENNDLHESIGEWQGRALGYKSACESLIDALCKVATS